MKYAFKCGLKRRVGVIWDDKHLFSLKCVIFGDFVLHISYWDTKAYELRCGFAYAWLNSEVRMSTIKSGFKESEREREVDKEREKDMLRKRERERTWEKK